MNKQHMKAGHSYVGFTLFWCDKRQCLYGLKNRDKKDENRFLGLSYDTPRSAQRTFLFAKRSNYLSSPNRVKRHMLMMLMMLMSATCTFRYRFAQNITWHLRIIFYIVG